MNNLSTLDLLENLIGMSIDNAHLYINSTDLKEHIKSIRIVNKNNQAIMITADFKPDRLDVFVDRNNIINNIKGIG